MGRGGHVSGFGKSLPDMFNSEQACYTNLWERHIHSFEKLRSHGFPCMQSVNGGPEEAFFGHEVKHLYVSTAPYTKKTCCRCKTSFDIDEYKDEEVKDRCCYHPSVKVTGEIEGRNEEKKYPCCQQPFGSKGCTKKPNHVYFTLTPPQLKTFIRTPVPAPGTSKNILILEASYVYTTIGKEISRIILLNWKGNLVFDMFVKTAFSIVDLNEEENDHDAGMYEQFAEPWDVVRSKLFELLNADTVLIGHTLDVFLRAAHLVHLKLLDTSVIYRNNNQNARYTLKSSANHHVKLEIDEKNMKDKASAIHSLTAFRINDEYRRSQSSSFSTQLKIFDGSVTNRPYPVGIWAEDNVQVSSLAQKLQFGLAEKCPFVVQGNGVFGLRFSQKPENHINILLRQFKYPIIGIGLTVGYSDAFPYNGELVLGGGSKKCQREYQYAQVNTVKYDSWIFDVQRVVFGQVTFTQDTPVTLAIGQRYTVFPLELFNKIVVELDARQADSQTQTYYVRYQGVKFPTIGFESYGVLLTMYPKDYLGKLTPYGYELLIRPKIDWAIPNDQIILGDNFLTAYCILLEYTVPPKIGFSMSECIPVVPNMIFLGFLVLLKVLVE
ncbi:unnamed protein product [Bursaphelenchus okinawaensis]|uniref:Peptidase A1 domain-containing protein n=1 Tax=Bursaphelenchus okinawaensis TaxID=465554 RepID=A0A811K2R4_9BILA|nr:unnamed protein product [Bursaphelenchus okinawaensis]CAG9090022.1 unnamed protein product [Bursaphelenchus okinawaensis]